MTQFEYLSVLISIIIGLALTQLLSGAARLIQIRRRVRPHVATLCWMATLFLLDTQIWWAAFGRRGERDWNFFLFLLYLTMPILAFLLSFLVLPELGDEDEIDLPANFAGNRPWFFALLLTLPLASLVEEALDRGGLPQPINLGFHIAFIGLSVVALCVRSPRFHTALAVATLGMVCGYIGLLFPHLH